LKTIMFRKQLPSMAFWSCRNSLNPAIVCSAWDHMDPDSSTTKLTRTSVVFWVFFCFLATGVSLCECGDDVTQGTFRHYDNVVLRDRSGGDDVHTSKGASRH